MCKYQKTHNIFVILRVRNSADRYCVMAINNRRKISKVKEYKIYT